MVTPPTLLIVDDDQETREEYARTLAEAGYRIRTADSFDRAVQVLRTAKPDLLIAEVRLGDFNGLQLIETSIYPVRALLVTKFADVVLERDARRRGAEFMVKPIARQQLLSTVAQLVASATPAAPARRWFRKPLASAIPISANQLSGRLMDVSDGGMRLEIDSGGVDLPSTLAVSLPREDRSFQVDVMWKFHKGSGVWLCGAAVAEGDARRAWREFVDTLQ